MRADTRRDVCFTIILCVAILSIVTLAIVVNMNQADRFSDCLQRGGEMRKIDDMVQCRLPGAK